VSYAPLDSDALFSTTFAKGPLPWAIFTAILSQKDQDGVTAVTPEVLAALWRLPVETIKAAWDELAAPDPRSKNKEHEGRPIIPTGDGRWLVVSHEKYRTKHRIEQRQETVRQAKRRQREREKRGVRHDGYLACACSEPATETTADGRSVCEKHADRDPGQEG
jgi:hypothetical protein